MPRAGSLREKVRIEERTRVPNDSGGVVEGWQTREAGLRARIIQKTGMEAVLADALEGLVTHHVHLRYSSRTKSISNLDRLADERSGQIHNIKSVTSDERDRVVILITQTGVRT